KKSESVVVEDVLPHVAAKLQESMDTLRAPVTLVQTEHEKSEFIDEDAEDEGDVEDTEMANAEVVEEEPFMSEEEYQAEVEKVLQGKASVTYKPSFLRRYYYYARKHQLFAANITTDNKVFHNWLQQHKKTNPPTVGDIIQFLNEMPQLVPTRTLGSRSTRAQFGSSSSSSSSAAAAPGEEKKEEEGG